MSSLLKIAKSAADLVLGLKNFKKFEAAMMKSHKAQSAAKDATKEVNFQLDSLSSLFGGFGGVHLTPKGSAVRDAEKLMREANEHLDQARVKMSAAWDRMKEVDWTK